MGDYVPRCPKNSEIIYQILRGTQSGPCGDPGDRVPNDICELGSSAAVVSSEERAF